MSENPLDPAAPSDRPPPPPYSAPPPPPPPMGGQVPAYGQEAQAPVSPSDARLWSLLAHVGGLVTTFVAPLVIFLIYKDRDPFIRRHAMQALNFQILVVIAYIVSSILSATFILAIIGIPLMLAAVICSLVFSIIAAMAANKGEEYTYPMVPQMVT